MEVVSVGGGRNGQTGWKSVFLAGLCLSCTLCLTVLCWRAVDAWGDFMRDEHQKRIHTVKDFELVDPFKTVAEDPFREPADGSYDDQLRYRDPLPSYAESDDARQDGEPGEYAFGPAGRNDDVRSDADVLLSGTRTVDAVASGVWLDGSSVGAIRNIWNDLETAGAGSLVFGVDSYGRERIRSYSERLPLEEGLSCRFDIPDRPGCEAFVRVAETGGVAVEARSWDSDYGPFSVVLDARLYRAGELVAEGYVCPMPVDRAAWTFALFPLDEPADEIQFAFMCTAKLEEPLGSNVGHTWDYDPETGTLSGELANDEAVPLSVEWVDLAFLNGDGLPVYGMTCEVPERLWPGESVRYRFQTGLSGLVPDTERVEAYVRADPHGIDGEGRYLR